MTAVPLKKGVSRLTSSPATVVVALYGGRFEVQVIRSPFLRPVSPSFRKRRCRLAPLGRFGHVSSVDQAGVESAVRGAKVYLICVKYWKGQGSCAFFMHQLRFCLNIERLRVGISPETLQILHMW